MESETGRFEKAPEVIFTLNDTEEQTLAANGVAWLRLRWGASAKVGDVVRVSGEEVYEVEIKEVAPSSLQNSGAQPNDMDFLVHTVTKSPETQ